jgi:hypothetical protein
MQRIYRLIRPINCDIMGDALNTRVSSEPRAAVDHPSRLKHEP